MGEIVHSLPKLAVGSNRRKRSISTRALRRISIRLKPIATKKAVLLLCGLQTYPAIRRDIAVLNTPVEWEHLLASCVPKAWCWNASDTCPIRRTQHYSWRTIRNNIWQLHSWACAVVTLSWAAFNCEDVDFLNNGLTKARYYCINIVSNYR